MEFIKLIGAAVLALAIYTPALAQNSNDEITLRTGSGDCAAYISNDDDSTIYLWNGEPVAYLVSQDVYGFNGKHLGWFIKGVVYNHYGDVVGAITSRFKIPQPVCAIKSIKSLKPLKSLKELRPLKPLFHLSWSDDETLKRFLVAGRDDD
jgi:4-fold beta flower protein